MPEFQGLNILEVWDFRLSTAVPVIDNSGPEWVVKIYLKQGPDFNPARPNQVTKPIREYRTGIMSEPGDALDAEKVAKCYEWLYTQRNDFARADIEILRPLVQALRDAEAALALKQYEEGSPEE